MTVNQIIHVYKKYSDLEINSVREKQAKCNHEKWVKKCSCCSAILDSEKLHEKVKVPEILI